MRTHNWIILIASLALVLPKPLLANESFPQPKTGQVPDRPNVLFIAVDDLNDWPRCMGKRQDTISPHIDKLASRGVLFTRAYCAAPACNPSRAALLTGVRPSTSGVYHNDQPWRPVLRDTVTLPAYFMSQGYLVVGAGKIFHGKFNDKGSWAQYHKTQSNPLPPRRPINGIKGGAQFDWGPLENRDEDMGDYQTVSHGVNFLKQKHEKPFFLAVGLTRPHLPFYAPKKYFDLYPLEKVTLPKVQANDLDDVPALGKKMAKPDGDHSKVLKANQWKQAVQAYLACITFADAQIGRLIEALNASPHARNTIIVLWGDHGWHLGEKEHWRKFALWEEATRTTFLMVAPSVTQPGGRCDRPVSLMDAYPTLIDLCALKPRQLEANSLLPLLRNPSAAWQHAALTTHGRNNHAIRTERWRYIRYADGSEELYDHQTDPQEWRNLAGDKKFAGTIQELKRHLPRVNAPDAPSEVK